LPADSSAAEECDVMTAEHRDDLTLPLAAEAGADRQPSTPIAAFVPIAVALIGVGLILFGGLTARDPATVVGAAVEVDQVVTGSIAQERDHHRDLMMLDR